jgi:hypothetical protein
MKETMPACVALLYKTARQVKVIDQIVTVNIASPSPKRHKATM